MFALYKDPQGKNVFKGLKTVFINTSTSHTHVPRDSNDSDVIHSGDDSELGSLRKKVVQLEEKLKLCEEFEVRETKEPNISA